MGHAKEPWVIDDCNRDLICVMGPDGVYDYIANADGPGNERTHEERSANAARIVACVNALAGVADPAAAVKRWKAIEEAAKDYGMERDIADIPGTEPRPVQLAIARRTLIESLALPGAEA